MLVASSGGHLAHLLWMRPWWQHHERLWVSFDTLDATERLREESVVWAHHPTNRHPLNLARNAALAWRTVGRWRPDLVVSTGAGVALPFLAAGRARGAGTVFIEVYDRIARPSLTGRLVSPWVDEVVLQWDRQHEHYPHGTVLGPLR